MDYQLTDRAPAPPTFGGQSLAEQPEAISSRKHKISELKQELLTLTNQRSHRMSVISEYEAFSPHASAAIMLSLTSDIDQLSTMAKSLAVKTTDLIGRITQESNNLCHPALFWRYLSSDQRRSRALLALLKEQESETKRKIDAYQKLIKSKSDALTNEKFRNDGHQRLDISKAKLELESCEDAIKATAASLETVQLDLASLVAALALHLSVQKQLTEEISKYSDDLLLANKYYAALKRESEDAKARRNIHVQCEDYFGEGSPSKVVDEIKSNKARASRDLMKIERRIFDRIRKHEMDIESIIIDGNNTCYTSGNEFIGLAALRVLAQHLSLKFAITIVFDASIRKLLKASTQDIQKNLGLGISTYVAPSKTAADEYILKLAEGNERSYIISNDRYSEWHDYAAIRDLRLINFLVASGKIMINDIDVSIDF